MSRRWMTGIGLVAAGSLILPHGVAYAEPSEAELEEEIGALQEEASGLVEELNEAEEDVEAAEKRLEELEEEIGDEEDRYGELREEVIGFASGLYSGSDLEDPMAVLTADSPEEIQEQSADVGHLSDNQQAQLDEFSSSGERVLALRDEAEDALGDAEDRQEELEEQRDEVEDTLADQEAELAELTGVEDTGVTGDDSGGSYTGGASGDAGTALGFAYNQIGKPYVWGGTGPNGYDCSGLTQAAWGAAGVSLPRTTGAQAGVGQPVAYGDLQPGDLVFFYSGLSHMGIYAGNGMMVHAPRSGRNVEEVALAGYWQGQFQTARRP